MSNVLKWLAKVPPLLLGLLFLAQGVMSFIRPEVVVRSWGVTLPEGGPALSSIVALFASFALTLGICLLISLFRKERFWFYAPIMMFFFLGLGRFVASVAHGAPLLAERFIPEFIFALLLYLSLLAVPRRES